MPKIKTITITTNNKDIISDTPKEISKMLCCILAKCVKQVKNECLLVIKYQNKKKIGVLLIKMGQ